MQFKRLFFDNSVNLKSISKQQFIIALVIGLASAFAIYSFFYVLREAFRIMSFGLMNFGFERSQQILSSEDRSFYNLFFAGLSLIIGNSIVVLFLFSKPDKTTNRYSSKRKRILNDQIFLSFNFLFWFNKIGIVFGAFSLCCLSFDYIPYFKPLTFLLLLVLYLESWKNLNSILKKNRFIIRVFHLIIMLVLTLGLSKIDIVDYKSLDQELLRYNPIVDLPKSSFGKIINNGGDREFVFKLKLDKNKSLEIYTSDLEKISLEQVSRYIIDERKSRRASVIPAIHVRVLADADINIKYIKRLELKLSKVNQLKIIYQVYMENGDDSNFKNLGIFKRINKSVLAFRSNIEEVNPIPFPGLRDLDNGEIKDTLRVTLNKQIKIDGVPVTNKDDMVAKFKSHINKNMLFLYVYNSQTNYQDFINVLSSHFFAANQLKEKEQTVFRGFDYQYDELYRNEQFLLNSKYPVIIDEILE